MRRNFSAASPVERATRCCAHSQTIPANAYGFFSRTIDQPVENLMHKGFVAVVTFLVAALPLAAAAGQPDEAGVRDTENRWSEAFIGGDATLDALLDADYVSVGANGQVRPKAEIIALATNYANAHPGQHASPLAASSTIRVIGSAAVVQHRNAGETSVDVFYFRDGRWRAWYSQHTRATN
jgi:hypothetical protein